MRKGATTICCSALALTLALSTAVIAQKQVAQLGLFPISVRWTKAIEANLSAPPDFDDSRIFLPLADGRLAAYDITDGHELWTVERQIASAPVVADGRVFLATDVSLIALDADTGQPAWQIALDAPLSAPVTADHGWTIITGSTGVVTALRTSDGSSVWSRDVASPPSQSVAIAAAHIYVPVRDGRVIALKLEDGVMAWERRLGGTPQPVLALGDRLYVGSDDNFLYCLMASDGRIDWRWQTGGDIVGKAAFDDQRIYFASKDNVLRALDRRNGAQRWKKPLPIRASSGPVAVRGAILLSGLSQSVQGFVMRDGAAAGDFDAGGLLAAPPHVVDSAALAIPVVVYVTRSLTGGATISAVTRNVEPQMTPVGPLPNPSPVTPLPGAEPNSVTPEPTPAAAPATAPPTPPV